MAGLWYGVLREAGFCVGCLLLLCPGGGTAGTLGSWCSSPFLERLAWCTWVPHRVPTPFPGSYLHQSQHWFCFFQERQSRLANLALLCGFAVLSSGYARAGTGRSGVDFRGMVLPEARAPPQLCAHSAWGVEGSRFMERCPYQQRPCQPPPGSSRQTGWSLPPSTCQKRTDKVFVALLPSGGCCGHCAGLRKR